MNLIISILANTYNIFDMRSNGLYLSKILSTRDDLAYDECYGAFLSSMPPINAIQIPFLPASIALPYGHPLLVQMNNFVMKLQYISFMMIFFSIFVLVTFALCPIAWIIAVIDKIKVFHLSKTNKEKILNLGIFIPFGLPIMFLNSIADIYYFWMNNFRTELQKIIILKE